MEKAMMEIIPLSMTPLFLRETLESWVRKIEKKKKKKIVPKNACHVQDNSHQQSATQPLGGVMSCVQLASRTLPSQGDVPLPRICVPLKFAQDKKAKKVALSQNVLRYCKINKKKWSKMSHKKKCVPCP
jgi:hypothetical protein